MHKNKNSKHSRQSIKNGATQKVHARTTPKAKAPSKAKAAPPAGAIGDGRVDVPLTKAEVDEAFEAITGHPRPVSNVDDAHTSNDSHASHDAEKSVDTSSPHEIPSSLSSTPAPTPDTTTPTFTSATTKENVVQLTLKGYTKDGRQAIYVGPRSSIYINKASFVDETAPATLELSGPLVGPKEAKPKLTPEERKALRAAQPKPTLAERIAKQRARLDKQEAALRASQGASA